MKTLLNITVFAASVLSIFSTSFTLYEVPILKESLSVLEKEKEAQESSSSSDIKRIYISNDFPNKGKEEPTPLFTAKKEVDVSKPAEDYINVFGVQIPTRNVRSNI